jgi:hypothetical protein
MKGKVLRRWRGVGQIDQYPADQKAAQRKKGLHADIPGKEEFLRYGDVKPGADIIGPVAEHDHHHGDGAHQIQAEAVSASCV